MSAESVTIRQPWLNDLIQEAEETVRHLDYELAKARAWLAWLTAQKQLPRDSA